jgi:hypothetical protein
LNRSNPVPGLEEARLRLRRACHKQKREQRLGNGKEEAVRDHENSLDAYAIISQEN